MLSNKVTGIRRCVPALPRRACAVRHKSALTAPSQSERNARIWPLLTPTEQRAVREQLPKPGSRVVVGMSGGVDSSVSAALLAETGQYDLIGCWMKNWDMEEESPSSVPVCTQEKDWKDASEVAGMLGIPLKQVDLVKEYWCNVWEPCLDVYKQGMTPNPDILCNKHVKFGAFLEVVGAMGASHIATGHYARLHPTSKKLMRGLDPLKDQSYFLCGVIPSAFHQACFPVGVLPKTRVKELALAAGFISVVSKPESQGVCFVGERGGRFGSFLEEYMESVPGSFIDVDTGKLLGQHQGTLNYTVGQRARIAGKSAPYFVAKKAGSQIFVAKGSDHLALKSDLAKARFDARIIEENDLSRLKSPSRLSCQVRYRSKAINCELLDIGPLDDGHRTITIRFESPENSVAEGQTLALYNNEICLGGGDIIEVSRPFLRG